MNEFDVLKKFVLTVVEEATKIHAVNPHLYAQVMDTYTEVTTPVLYRMSVIDQTGYKNFVADMMTMIAAQIRDIELPGA